MKILWISPRGQPTETHKQVLERELGRPISIQYLRYWAGSYKRLLELSGADDVVLLGSINDILRALSEGIQPLIPLMEEDEQGEIVSEQTGMRFKLLRFERIIGVQLVTLPIMQRETGREM